MMKNLGIAAVAVAAAWTLAVAAGEPTTASKPSTEPARELVLDLGGSVDMKLVLIPAGKFQMGSPKVVTEEDWEGSECPQREVTITKPFFMGAREVTQKQYERIVGKNASDFKGPQNPVDNVTWVGAVDFCKALAEKTGKSVRLPTEAEWEHACRAGTTTRFSYGDDPEYRKLGDYAWYGDNSTDKEHPKGAPHAVGLKKPNGFGLYDMYGNAQEWCSDWYDAKHYAQAEKVDPKGPAKDTDRRVLRGGSWCSGPHLCRSASRDASEPAHTFPIATAGFRVVVDCATAASSPTAQPARP